MEQGDASNISFKLADINLRVGDRLQLQSPVAFGQEKLIVKLVGFRENVSILTTIPHRDYLPLPLLEGDAVHLGSFSGTHAFRFTSSVLKVCKTPFDYLHLSFPNKVNGASIRKSPRFQTAIEACATEPASSEAKACTISNLSISGMMVLAGVKLASMSETLNLGFKLCPFDTEFPVEVSAAIRNVEEREGESGDISVSHGMEFLKISPEERMVVGSFLYQKMIEGGKLL